MTSEHANSSGEPADSTSGEGRKKSLNFIEQRVVADLEAGRGPLVTRFPPEPNGYLHIGHAKAICLNFALAEKYGGRCNLRFDDTNPVKENTEFVESIEEDIRWLGFDWGGEALFTSSYFERLYELACDLIRQGLAYVCDLSGEETREHRGTLTSPGKNSPYRDRPVEENLDLFARMRAGEFEDGARSLKAKIDMASPNMNLRDPVMYRIVRAHHHRVADAWCLYPTYDWAHGQSDALEGITHSLCSLEFENHRPLYDWYLDHLDIGHPEQIEFARLALSYTVMSKRKLRQLVEEGHVSGWDDPRMPTLSGFRRRGYTAKSIRDFCETIGVAKFNSMIDRVLLDNALRDELNRTAERRLAVLDPLEVVITNYPDGQTEELDAVNNPEDESAGTRKVPFAKRILIEKSDFKEEAPRKYFRLKPGQEVRLRYAYYITCTDFEKDPDTGEVVRVFCTYDPESRGGSTPDGRKVKGTIHWVSAEHAFEAEVRLYDHLFEEQDPDHMPDGKSFLEALNPKSLEVVTGSLEPSLEHSEAGEIRQFERHGYFCVDSVDSKPGKPIFNRAVALRDSWAKLEKKLGQ